MRPLRIAAATAALAVTVLVLAFVGVAVYLALRASLPQLDGEIAAPGLCSCGHNRARRQGHADDPRRVASRSRVRDRLRARAGSILPDGSDAARGCGRAGGVARRVGARYWIAKLRLHGFRRVAREVVAGRRRDDRALLDAYAAGVNCALSRRGARPWEYSAAPHAAGAMAHRRFDAGRVLDVSQLERFERQRRSWRARSCAKRCRPLFAFLHPLGTEWDAPVVGGNVAGSPDPGPGSVRSAFGERAAAALRHGATSPGHLDEEQIVGSNSWAVAGTHAPAAQRCWRTTCTLGCACRMSGIARA